MLTLAILGFLYEQPLHGYELKDRIQSLTGHVKAVSDGALYPALTRLESAGLLTKQTEPGAAGAPRQTLSLTDAGRAELLRRLREPSPGEISDRNKYFTLLAFLRHLPDKTERDAVLQQRLDFLDAPARFFSADGRTMRSTDLADPYRRGMIEIAKATRDAERAWLRSELGS
ncbi:MAG: PadR family transcriptional regulator [Hamadaea sp.]|uniref:PadR family transcriptional regulator n=1 Tax=Hamadaea sp. TaxID=2024425 RepID=UPI0017A5D5DB|nr:PadR family transcriptional regulator [Hamadaea sp.]NUR69426.1 PadR family transcriptional regulator [Hamadaea sp.]NUT23841.1 PadR family transcriptional regulator [Hamadaea sp.]